MVSQKPTGKAAIPARSQGFYRDPETGDKYRSVTTILQQGVPKEALPFWAGNIVAASAIENLPYLVKASRRPAERVEAERWLSRAHTRKKDERGDVGSAVHDIIEAHVLGLPFPAKHLDNPDMAPFLQHFLSFIDDYSVAFDASEMVVANPDEMYAGTLDYLVRSQPLVDMLTARGWLELNADVAIAFMGDTKGLALDTPLPTPTGWTTMAAVQIGDILLDSAGRPCAVTETSDIHERDCYRVTFDDRSSVVCDDEHLWMTDSGVARYVRKVSSTVDLRGTLRQYGTRQHRVPVAAPLDLPDVPLPVDPYVLGCWLGDGKHTSGEICKPDVELFDLIRARGYDVGPPQHTSRPDACPSRSVYGLVGQLRAAGVLGDKHIPDVYLRAGRRQREALVQGLMDTDGCWNRARNSVAFVSVSKAFASSVRELLLSIGQRAVMFEARHTGFKAGVHYTVTFTPVGLLPFRLSRKADLVNVPSTVRSSRRLIVSIEPTLTVPTKCIAVDSPDRTYLCTEAMIPTHNTGGEMCTGDGLCVRLRPYEFKTCPGGPLHTIKGVYPDAGLQMSAYKAAKVAWLRDGQKVPMPPTHDVGIVLHLRPEGYIIHPMRCGPDVFAYFPYARKVAEWATDASHHVIGDPFTAPVPSPKASAA